MELFFKTLTGETWFFIVLLSIVAITLLVKKELQKAPAILTTIAILGTFVGIAIGLYHFDANNVQKSIPLLINGIKTAFFASIYGIFVAILFKFVPVLLTKKDNEIIKEDVTAEDLHSVLIQIKKSLADDTDSSLISQFKLLRTDFGDFLKNASENNSKALIEALKDVMRDFNAKINEQFGENFKQLNQAVGDILVWQKEYRNQVTEMIEQNNQSAKNLSEASKDFSMIVDNTKSFTSAAEKCGLLINTLDEKNKSIEDSIQKLASYIDIAKNGLPDIQNNLLKTMEQMQNITVETGNAVKDKFVSIIQENDSFLKNQFNEMNVQNKNLQDELRKTLVDTLTTSTNEIKSQAKITQEDLSRNTNDLTNAIKTNVSELKQQFVSSLQENDTVFRNQFREMNSRYDSLQDELRKILMDTLVVSTNEIKSQAKITQEDLSRNTNDLTNAIKNNVGELKQQFMLSTQENDNLFKNQLRELSNNHKTLQDELRKLLLESLQASNSEVNTQIKNLIEQTRQQVVTLDKALGDELTKSLESFGKQMASLSSRFANDYTPLTDKLREIVQIANKVKT